ncbi:pre-rRNA-processing protein TSR1 homolog [Pocillopora verrucosa]|uniref:pre-rRNA-processing protein TSR1 homolog n=1 Tax=Pocillopora verrucosa TaxID=203993 RepID=UPI00279766CC|nr:pre-rRNA-processing protein TSR1 homolog [Pocillopora verrucosa]
MNSEFVTVLFLVIFASWQVSAFDAVNGNNFDFQMKGNLAEENDNGIEDIGTRVERERNREFYADDLENSDEDLFFSKDDDELKKSIDYSDWDAANKFTEINDELGKEADEEEKDENKEKEEEEKEKEKGILRRLFEKFKNWIHKVGK